MAVLNVASIKAGVFTQTRENALGFDDLKQLEEEFDGLDDTGRAKHLFACYGLAAYWAQCLEVSAMQIILSHARATKRTWSPEKYDAVESKCSRKTLGVLLQDVRTLVELDDKAIALMDEALEKRNFLSHRFFEARAANWYSEAGQREMLSELLSCIALFRDADMVADCIVKGLCKVCGITEQWIEEEFQRMIAEARGVRGAVSS